MLKDKILNVIKNHELMNCLVTYTQEVEDCNYETNDEKVVATNENLIIELEDE